MSITSSPSQASTEALKGLFSEWKKTVEAELKGAAFDKKLVTRTPEEIAIQPLYTRLETKALPHLEKQPGEAPFLRGTRPFGYKNNSWELCQEVSSGDLQEFNKFLLADLMKGQDSVELLADLATREGLDPDAEPSKACKGGLPLFDVEAVATALRGVQLGAVPVHVSAGANALPLGAIFLAYAAREGVDASKLRGSLCADPISSWVSTGQQPAALLALHDALASWVRHLALVAPQLKSIGVDARVWHEAGASATEELAFAMASAISYLRALQKRGIEPRQAAASMRFSLGVGPQFFTEVAKFRAFRLLWSRVLSAFGCPEAAALSAVHARTGLHNKTLLDPHVNMLRVTTEALSAVLGGCDSLHIGPYDEVSGATDDFSRRIARNVHILLAEEFGFTEVADPAGGSWYVESLSDGLARKAWEILQKIESAGGMGYSLRAGIPQKMVAATAAGQEEAVAKRRSGLVGTNLFPNLREKSLGLAPAPLSQAEVAAAAVAARRPAPPAGIRANDVAALVEDASRGATIGQMSLLSLTGTVPGDSIIPLQPRRLSEGFEELRRASEAWLARTGSRPKAFLAKMGPVIQHKARADFSAGFLAVGGIESLAKQGFETPESAAAAAAASGAPIAVLCSTDETYPALVPAFAQALKAARPDVIVLLAGLPSDKALAAQFKAQGIDDFIHLRANARELLANLLRKMGAL